MEKLGLDDRDREIISLLEDDPRTSQREIAEQLGISQPSVGIRLHKLREKGAISLLAGINFRKIGLYLAKVEVTAKDTAEVLNFFKECPYFLNGLAMSGKNNLCLFLMGEDLASIEAIVNTHLRSNPKIDNVDFDVVISSTADLIFPVKMKLEKRDKQPCGYEVECKDCSYFKVDRCLGCPITGQYKGSFW
ncbi:MAG: Lrp/AsnC family transcriptional regulator [Candidatus Hydrothermarchaeales archaeon]